MMMVVRATGIYVAEQKLLMLRQSVDSQRHYSLPGGKLEIGETLESCLIREMKEETGLDIIPKKLLYICDHIKKDIHVVYISFEVKKVGGSFDERIKDLDTVPIESVEMLPLDKLEEYGLSLKFANLVRAGFPGAGSYMGAKKNIGL